MVCFLSIRVKKIKSGNMTHNRGRAGCEQRALTDHRKNDPFPKRGHLEWVLVIIELDFDVGRSW